MRPELLHLFSPDGGIRAGRPRQTREGEAGGGRARVVGGRVVAGPAGGRGEGAVVAEGRAVVEG